ncbi:MAG TPA: NUDIX domain-containing protein [Armatimonadota bacterium]|nr:NUDIX domain-containing protein [Armatimonadota bacterium]
MGSERAPIKSGRDKMHERTLDEIVPAGAPQGAGIFTRLNDNRYMFCLNDASLAGSGGGRLELGRIGGRREHAETWGQCIQRELMEEVGCRATVESAAQCFYADLDGHPSEIAVSTLPRPLLISRQPVSRDVIPEGVYYNVVFWARLQGEPRPLSEIHGLVLLEEALLRLIMSAAFTVRRLQAAGVEIIPARELDPDAKVGLGRAPSVLVELLNRGQAG